MTRVLIVDEVRLMASVVASVLEDEDDLRVVGVAATVDEAIEALGRCNVMVVSTTLPGDGALRVTQEAATSDPPVRVVVMGLSKSKDQILQYIECGASGYVLRDDTVEALVQNIKAVSRQRAHVSPTIAAALMERVAELTNYCLDPGPGVDGVELTAREKEVLNLIGHGDTNAEIGEKLRIEVGTVKNHVHNILKKLNVGSRQEAAAYLDRIGRQLR